MLKAKYGNYTKKNYRQYSFKNKASKISIKYECTVDNNFSSNIMKGKLNLCECRTRFFTVFQKDTLDIQTQLC